MISVKNDLSDAVCIDLDLSGEWLGCDRCGNTVRAVVEIVHPSWASELVLCAHHSRKVFGYESAAYRDENKLKGSAN